MGGEGSLALFATSLPHAIGWWGVLLLLNLLGWQVLRPALAGWHDAGWAIARPLCVLTLAYATWVAGHVAPVFVPGALWALVALCAIAAMAMARRRPPAPVDRALAQRIIAAELRFALPFAFYLAMRGFSHDAIGLEKFMDFSFVASAMRTASMPVPDPWWAGGSINYYYFGHYLAAFLCKLSGTSAGYGYNLMLATIFGGTFQLAYAFVAEMARATGPRVRGTMAFVAAAWIAIGGNIHGFLYGFVKPWLVGAGVVAPPRQAFLLSDPTRFVGWDPPTQDKLIHEFPAYAFYVGDLHGHLSNLPGVLLLLCVLLAWQRARREAAVIGRRGWLLCAAWLVGVFAITNSWDALMYTTVLGALLVSQFVAAVRAGREQAVAAVGDGVRAACVTAATVAPFLLYFTPHSQGFFPTHTHTPVWQWLILYGLQAALALAGCTLALRAPRQLLAAPERTLLVALTAFGIAFALFPEFVYLKDIYGSDYYRGNTAFKFGFQAFTLLTLCACVAVALLLAVRRAWMPRVAVVILLELALVPPLYYSWFFVKGGFGVWREREWTLDGQRYLTLSHPEDKAVIGWLRQHARDGRPLVEAVGESYTFGARIATNSGVANIIGWPVHQQLWRGSSPEVWRRRDEVAALYTAKSAADAKPVLDRYRPRWLVVGRFERERYPTMDAQLLASLGHVVFRSGETFVVELERAR